jgi:glutamyl-tRNA reductase
LATHLSELERLSVVFATFRDHTPEQRAADAERLAALPARERVLIETCHRVELVMIGDSASADAPGLSGRAAVERVFSVVAGFDSAVVAEEQLIGQVRAAYERGLAAGETGPVLNELFRRALRFGRRVRTHARPGTDRSLADRGAVWVLTHVAPRRRVLVAGTGEMGRLVARRLAEAGHPVTVLSRSAERGAAMRDALNGGPHGLTVGALSHALVAEHGALALAVRAREPLLEEDHLDGDLAPWTLDLSVPSAVSLTAAARLGERLMSVDRLGTVGGSSPVFPPAIERRLRRELRAEVDGFVRWLEARRTTGAVALLRAEAETVRRRHLDQLQRRAGLDPEQLAAVDAATAAMIAELMHRPTVAVRHGGADAPTVRRLFGVDT